MMARGWVPARFPFPDISRYFLFFWLGTCWKIAVSWHEQSLACGIRIRQVLQSLSSPSAVRYGGPDPPPSPPFHGQGLWAMALALACQVKFGWLSNMDSQGPCNSRVVEIMDRAAGPLCHSWARQSSENLVSALLSGWRGVPVCKGDSEQKSSHMSQCRWLISFWGKKLNKKGAKHVGGGLWCQNTYSIPSGDNYQLWVYSLCWFPRNLLLYCFI